VTRGKRCYLLALVEGRICDTCRFRIIEPHMLPWSSECPQCRIARVDMEFYP
jgi:hypothetical protein